MELRQIKNNFYISCTLSTFTSIHLYPKWIEYKTRQLLQVLTRLCVDKTFVCHLMSFFFKAKASQVYERYERWWWDTRCILRDKSVGRYVCRDMYLIWLVSSVFFLLLFISTIFVFVRRFIIYGMKMIQLWQKRA